MTLYSLVLFGHVTAVLALFACLSLETLSLFHLRRASTLPEQPSVATSQPAFIPSSIRFPILFISSCDGGAFFSTDLYMLRNFIAISVFVFCNIFDGVTGIRPVD